MCSVFSNARSVAHDCCRAYLYENISLHNILPGLIWCILYFIVHSCLHKSGWCGHSTKQSDTTCAHIQRSPNSARFLSHTMSVEIPSQRHTIPRARAHTHTHTHTHTNTWRERERERVEGGRGRRRQIGESLLMRSDARFLMSTDCWKGGACMVGR